MSMSKVIVIQGDITKVTCDAIVNAANTSLLGGGGVDGAIHKAGGLEILEECRMIRSRQGGCKVGEAVITNAGKLKATKVIHTVGPVWNEGKLNEEELLRSCYMSVLKLAVENNLKSIAIPNISTGIYKFPKSLAARIAVEEVMRFQSLNNLIDEIIFVCFDKENYDIYLELLN